MLLFFFFFLFFLIIFVFCQGYELSGEIALKNNHYYYYYYIVSYVVFVLFYALSFYSGHEGVQWVLETYYVQYNNHGHVDELVLLLIRHNVKRSALR